MQGILRLNLLICVVCGVGFGLGADWFFRHDHRIAAVVFLLFFVKWFLFSIAAVIELATARGPE